MGTNKAEEIAKEIYRDNPTDEKGADYKYNTDIHAPKKRKAFLKGYMYRQSEIDELTKEVERLRKEMEIEKMQIMGRQKGLIYYPNYVSFNLMSEEMAQKNHGQSLRTLNSRGGMSVMEILANIKNDRIVKGVETQDDINELNKLILNYPLPPINQ